MSDFVFGTRYPYGQDLSDGTVWQYADTKSNTNNAENNVNNTEKDIDIKEKIATNSDGDATIVIPVQALGYTNNDISWAIDIKKKDDNGNEYKSYSSNNVTHINFNGDQWTILRVGASETFVTRIESDISQSTNFPGAKLGFLGSQEELIELKNKINKYKTKKEQENIFGNSQAAPGIARVDKFEPFEKGNGKYLKLKFYKGGVAEIGKLLGNGLVRKDSLFNNSADWKVASKIEVDENIELIPENFVFRSGFKYSLGMATEVTNSGPFKTLNNLAGGAAMIDAISKSFKESGTKLNNNITFSERINRYRNIPYFKDMDNNCIDSLNFKFNYGQYGLYSCLEEVVKPIIALADILSYRFVDYNDKEEISTDTIGNSDNLYIDSNFEPKFNIMTKMYRNLFTNTQKALKTILNDKSKQTASTLSGIPEILTHLVNSAAMEAKTQVFTFSIGSSLYGPFYASSIKWEFDYERTDEKGLPFAGTITISGIKPLLVESLEGLLLTGGQIISNGA